MKYFLTSLIFLSTFSSILAQSDIDKKLSKKKLIEQADYYFFKENFPKALELYQEILDNYPKNHYTQYHTFVAEHLSFKRGGDLSALLEYEENEGHTDKFYNYWMGRIHFLRYEFDLSKKHFEAFLEINVYRTSEIKKETLRYIAACGRAEKFYLDTNGYEIETIGAPINSEQSDISPAFFSDHGELLFMSARESGQPKGDFMVFHALKNDDSWLEPSVINDLGSFDPKHSKIEVVNNDGRLFMYKDEDGGDLYYSELVNEKWTRPKEFNSALRNNLVGSHFFINDAEDLILFAAESKDNKLEIFQSSYNPSTDEWSSPFAVLGDLNTRYNEDNPYLSHDGKYLYFSSDRKESIGGYDVFRVELDPKSGLWSNPTNLGFPINTVDNEVNFQLNPDNISGFLSSDRLHGQGGYDIYYFHKQGKVLASGKVYNKATKELIKGARVDFHPMKYKDETFRSYSTSFGEYKSEIFQDEDFIVEITLGSDLVFTGTVTSKSEQLRKIFTNDFYLDVPEHLTEETDFTALYDGGDSEKPTFEKMDKLGSKYRKGEKAIINNIYFDLDATTANSDSAPALANIAKMMKKNPNLKIEIAGHTCSLGTAELNRRVSEARAQYIKSYLTKKGISSNRLRAKGYGETQPLASNDDEEEGRELNRRIEIRVVQ